MYLEEAAAGEYDGVVGQGGVGDDKILLRRLERLHQRVVGVVQYLSSRKTVQKSKRVTNECKKPYVHGPTQAPHDQKQQEDLTPLEPQSRFGDKLLGI